jgi:acyl dehydratase
MMRMACDGVLLRMASLGSPGVDEMRWKKPVRPGVPYTGQYRVLEKRDMASRVDVGLSKITVELLDDKGEIAAAWISNQLTRRRSPLSASSGPRPPSAPRAPLPDIWSVPSIAAGTSGAEGYFEDRQVGETVEFAPYAFARDAILDFARQFDPQPFHLDEEAAKRSLFGALCASGWHTGSAFIRRVVDARRNIPPPAPGEKRPAYGPSPGFRNLRWFKPVYVGDTVTFRSQVSGKIEMKSRPTRGIIENEVQGRNQKGEVVIALTSQIIAERRHPGPTA